MKNFNQRDGKEIDTKNSFKSNRKKNMKRLGGGGLSLQTFANLKSKNSSYNPALIKKKKEFYRNARYVSKFRKSIKKENNFHDKVETGETSSKVDDNDDGDEDKKKVKSNKRIGLEDVYKKTKEEMDKARMEREAVFKEKKEAKEAAESRRREAKGKMMRKTRHGQPVMKYRIERLLESIKKTAGIDGSRNG